MNSINPCFKKMDGFAGGSVKTLPLFNKKKSINLPLTTPARIDPCRTDRLLAVFYVFVDVTNANFQRDYII